MPLCVINKFVEPFEINFFSVLVYSISRDIQQPSIDSKDVFFDDLRFIIRLWDSMAINKMNIFLTKPFECGLLS